MDDRESREGLESPPNLAKADVKTQRPGWAWELRMKICEMNPHSKAR